MKQYTEMIPLELGSIRAIVNGIENADYLYEEYVKEENFPTNNGNSGSRWNYINKAINNTLPVDRFQIEVMERPLWQFLGIYDRTTDYLYTLMRQRNLSTLRKSAEDKIFHYTNALSKLNGSLKSLYYIENEQMSLWGNSLYDLEGEEKLEKILDSLVKRIDGDIKCYVLVSFDISYGQVTSIKGVIPSCGMGYYKEEDWNEALSYNYTLDGKVAESVIPDDIIILERKPKLRRKNKDSDKEKMDLDS